MSGRIRRDIPVLLCVGCNCPIEVGDRYIKDTASGFLKSQETSPELDSLLADIFGGSGGQIVFCEDCCQSGGDYLPETYYGEDDAA